MKFLAILNLCAVAALAGAPRVDVPRAASEIRLAVIIVVDQLPVEVLARLEDLYAGGLKRLMNEGAYFTNCHFQHGVTSTGPGHATLLTGATPDVHGIVGNYWPRRTPQGWLHRVCVHDPAHRVVGGASAPADGISPKVLRAATLGDQLKASHPQARVVACSLKARAAVLSGGRRADAAFWWQRWSGGCAFVTSSYYQLSAADWLTAFNARRPADAYLSERWTRLLPSEVYDHRCREDDAAYEGGSRMGVSDRFPHPYAANEPYLGVLMSPAGNQLLLDFSVAAMDSLQLGRRDTPDLLVVSLSSNDEVGHVYGPHSHEVMDITLRTDRQLAVFMNRLDERVGLQNCLIALTSDHGVAMMPEYAQHRGLPAGRLDSAALGERIERRFVTRFGKASGDRSYVVDTLIPWLYFDPDVLAERRVGPAQLREAIDSVVAAETGIAAAFMSEDIQRSDFARTPLTRQIRRSWYPGHAGHVYLHLEKNWYYKRVNTGHGTAHAYDTHVPLMLLGPGIRPGRYDEAAAPSDLAPTLARLLHIPPPPKATGRVLVEAMASKKHSR